MRKLKEWYRERKREDKFLWEHKKEYWHATKHFVLWYGLACVALFVELMFIPRGLTLSGIELYVFLIASIVVLAGIGTAMLISIKGAGIVQTELKQKYNYPE